MAYEGGTAGAPAELETWRRKLDGAEPQAVLEAALAAFGDRIALVSSFGAESAVLLHMLAEVRKDAPVLFLDTGMLFGQTLDYRVTLVRSLGLTNVRDLRAQFQDLAMEDPDASLWKRDTDACCRIRKVLPLDRALGGFDAWITGRKRYQGGDRVRLPVIESDSPRLKFNPLAAWSKTQVAEYAERHALPEHPLVAFGYPSLGCWPCTSPVEAGADERSGRWSGMDKTECGIHLPRRDEAVEVGGDI